MSLVVFKKLILNPPEPTAMWLLIVDRTVNNPMGISIDVIVRVDNFIFLANFIILYYEVDIEMPIILERPFMATYREIVDMEKREINISVND